MEEAVHMENDGKQKISTLVFMDLETTGLPSDVGTRNVHITEMSLVAVDRNSFEVDRNLRVINKISLCIRPRSVISPICMDITGLYNDILENQEEFNDSVPKMLEYFFRRLQKPICLLAHNGNRFDFPVLQAELNRLNYSLGSDIVCADTLVAFQSICGLKKQQAEAERKTKEEEIVKCCENAHISEEYIDNLLSDDIESFSQIDVELASVDEKALEPGLTEISSSENKSLPSKHILSPTQDEKTPQKPSTPQHLNQNGNVHRKRKILDPTYFPKYQYKKRVVPAKRNLFPDPARRNLLPEHSSPFPEIHNITKFSLQHLYHYFFNENPPNSHYAEIDCISLSKVCQKVNKDFLQWVDDNNVAFSTINALW